jgi:hypothetical protein
MAHFSNDLKVRSATPVEWLGVGAQIGNIVNAWALREDLVVNLGKTTIGAPAAFNPASAEIEIDTECAFFGYAPAEIGDLSKRKTQLEFAMASGAIFHEALHARFTRWSLVNAMADLSPRDCKALHTLEEGRIESWGVRVMPNNQVMLRACAMEIVIGDIDSYEDKLSSVDGAAFMAALTLARVDAGVLEMSDIEPIVPILEAILGVDNIERLRSVWLRFQAHDQHALAEPLYALAKEWNQILDDIKVEKGETGDEGQGEKPQGGTPGPSGAGNPGPTGTGTGTPGPTDSGQPGQPSDGEGGEGGLGKILEDIKDAIQEMRDSVNISNQMDIDDAIVEEEWKEQLAERESEAQTKKNHKAVFDSVFNNSMGGDGDDNNGKTKSRLIETRAPKSAERVAAVQVSRLLAKAKYRERSQTEVQSILPPGRLRTRALVQGQALKSKGVSQQVAAWRQNKRKHTDDPTLNVGIMVDISASMKKAMNPMAITAWVMSEAVHRVQGKCAMVYYGNDAFATLKPGQRLNDVKVYSATDGTEKFSKAFKALDGGMNLLHGDGARLLVVVSDGYYASEERPMAKKWLKECDRKGVAVLWLTFDGGNSARRTTEGTNAQVVCIEDGNPTTAATIIGKAAAGALEKVGSRRA